MPKPEFNGQGYPIGSFRVLPVLAVENTYNDNIFVDSASEEGDYVVSIIPALGIESTWERHFVSLGVFAKIDRYANFSTENNEEYGAAATGVFDLSGGSSMLTDLDLGRRTIGRANAENTGRTDPEQLDFLNFDFSYRHEFSRFQLDIDPFVAVRDYIEEADADGTTDGAPDGQVPLTAITSDAEQAAFFVGTYLGEPAVILTKTLGSSTSYPWRTVNLIVRLRDGFTSLTANHYESAGTFWTGTCTLTRQPQVLVNNLTEFSFSTAASNPHDAVANPDGVSDPAIVRLTIATTDYWTRDGESEWNHNVEELVLKPRN